MTPTQPLDEFAWHEALHTAHLIEELFDAHLWLHPVIQQTPGLRERARTLSVALGELYQAIDTKRPPGK